MKLSQLKLTSPYLELDSLFYDKVKPTPLHKPFLISASKQAAKFLGVDEDITDDEKVVDILNGTYMLEGTSAFAMCYVGHQFGYFVPRLGDGRAINLGKVNGQNLQLKGSGLTLYSRQGEAIEKAQENDFTMIDDLLTVAHNPFEEHEELEHLCKLAPMESKNIKLSCSS